MTKLGELYALEYSTIQDCFHLDTLQNTLETNLNACLNKSNNDYQIIFIGTSSECKEFFDTLKQETNQE